MDVNIGDIVRIIAIPRSILNLSDNGDFLQTRHLFHCCVGNTFRVRDLFRDLNEIELWVTDDGKDDDRAIANTIWVDRWCVELVNNAQ